MKGVINSELVEAYLQCHRKAYLMLRSQPKGVPHEYEQILTERECENRNVYLESVTTIASDSHSWNNWPEECQDGVVVSEDLRAYCDAISQVDLRNRRSHVPYEPHLVVGTHSITKEQRIRLAFAGFVIGEMRRYRPKAGSIVPVSEKPQRISLESLYPAIRTTIADLRKLINTESQEPPSLILNEHCLTCPFRHQCLREAEEDDNLSLLGRMTPKLIKKYQAKGILTVTQLSYIFRPRRRRKRQQKAPSLFNVELQALALRTGKIYLNESPSIPENPVELFLDIEGIPDENFHYLIGLLIRDHDKLTEYSFWANCWEDEKSVFEECIEIASNHGDAPIYHYGSYEPKTLLQVQQKHEIDCKQLTDRLINVNSLVFGKVYFPSRSNRLKDLGALVGATWDSPEASGIQSLVWRMQWENTRNPTLKKMLVSYNMSDCHAVRLLVSELRELEKAASNRDDVDFPDNPKQRATDEGLDIHDALERILWSANAEYQRHRIRIGSKQTAKERARIHGAPKGHPGYARITPTKANKTVRVRRRLKCPSRHHRGQLLEPTGEDKEHTIIDLKFSKNGCRKIITKYVGEKARCTRCKQDFLPPAISRIQGRLFGHSFQAWAVYQRIVLRLPYTAITSVIENLFSEQITEASIVNFVRRMADLYNPTEKALLRRILASPFIHVDETKISIQGVDNYVWVLTDGSHVVFRLTETRETTLVSEILAGYSGVLVSDFYAGYDSVARRQQKCLVHLIRDLNDDLWKNPFNKELEKFVGEVADLLDPIFHDVERYGLKARHLRKHRKAVDRFFRNRIDLHASTCEIVSKYQKRFQRYRESLFLFLQEDGIPWNNNMAERAIRHLAIQRKISGAFYWQIAIRYLRLLGIAQTCRFQNKSFLRFLLSEEKDVDGYREGKRLKSTRLIVRDRKTEVD